MHILVFVKWYLILTPGWHLIFKGEYLAEQSHLIVYPLRSGKSNVYVGRGIFNLTACISNKTILIGNFMRTFFVQGGVACIAISPHPVKVTFIWEGKNFPYKNLGEMVQQQGRKNPPVQSPVSLPTYLDRKFYENTSCTGHR